MFNELKNRFDFFIRSKTKFSRKNYFEDESLTEDLNNYTFDILSQYLKIQPAKSLKVLDIGSKNWAYVKGEYKFFKQFTPELRLDGVEIDAYRLYSNFYSRYEVAKFYTKNLAGVNYFPENLLNINNEYDYIVWFLPFVTQYPHKRWGLPEKYFMPEKLLNHAFNILKKDMLIINQGKDEAEIQENLFKLLNIKYVSLGLISSTYLKYKNERYGFIVQKNA